MKCQGGRALAIPMDLKDPEQITHGLKSVLDQLGPVDVLINHPGNAAWSPVSGLTPEQFTQAWRVGSFEEFLCTKEVLQNTVNAAMGCNLFLQEPRPLCGDEPKLLRSAMPSRRQRVG
jgi:NAD(P)-dependent dehydrogenase (short-subunit alcohol dehydrogenase family)